jgi:hypothetical protein
MGVFGRFRQRRRYQDFHESALAAEREVEPLRMWLLQEAETRIAETERSGASYGKAMDLLTTALIARIRDERVSLEAMQWLLGGVTRASDEPARKFSLAYGAVEGAFAQLKGANRPEWWTGPGERARRGY